MERKVVEKVWELQELGHKYSNIIIYGAGVYGQLFLQKLYELNIYKKVIFAVTGAPSVREVMGVDVYSIEECTKCVESTIIVVAVGEKLAGEMVSYLEQIGVDNYIQLSNELRSCLKETKRISERGIGYLEKKFNEKQEVIRREYKGIYVDLQKRTDEKFVNVSKELEAFEKDVSKELGVFRKDISDDFKKVSKAERDILKPIIEQERELLTEIYQSVRQLTARVERLERLYIQQENSNLKVNEIYDILKGNEQI